MRLNKDLFKTDRSLTDVHYDTRVAYSAVHRYFNHPEDMRQVRLDTLEAILTKGMGLDLSELRFLDVFTNQD